MTNFGALAVLAALREHDARSPRGQRRLRTVRTQSLLTALETFPAGADGWREVSAEELRESARLNRRAFDPGRQELIDAKLIEYRPGTHRGEKSRWRITFPVDEPPAKKVPPLSRDLPGPEGAATVSGPSEGAATVADSTTVEGAPTRPGKVTTETHSGPSADSGPLTSHDVSAEAEPGVPTALEPSALRSSASLRTPRTGSRGRAAATDDDDDDSSAHPLTRAARDPRTLLDGLGTEDQLTEHILGWLDDHGIGDPFGYLLAIIGRHPDAEDGIRQFLDHRRRELAGRDADDDQPPRPPKPPWCGECDEHTRLTELPDGPARCIRCHPLSVQPPEEPAPSTWLKPWCGQCDQPDTRWAEARQPDGTVKLERCPDCGIRR